jgi:hypothetical protein
MLAPVMNKLAALKALNLKKASVQLAGRAVSSLILSLHFVMGFSWLKFTQVFATESFSIDPDALDVSKMWACAATMIFGLLLPGLTISLWRISQLERKAQLAGEQGDDANAMVYRVRARNLKTMMTWGCGFALGGQINGAAAATVPKSPWTWQLAYVGIVHGSFNLLAVLIILCGRRYKKSFHKGGLAPKTLAETLISTGAYTYASAFLGMVVAAFHLHDNLASSDLAFLGLFLAVTLVLAALVLVILAWTDLSSAKKKFKPVAPANVEIELPPKSEIEVELEVIATSFRTYSRQFIATLVTMCSVMVLYMFCYAAIMRGTDNNASIALSVYSPLPWSEAIGWLVALVPVAVLAGLAIDYCLKVAIARLTAIDRDAVPGPFDDLFLALVQMLFKTIIAALVKAMVWLLGMVMQDIMLSALHAAVDVEALSSAEKVGIAAAYAVGMSVISFSLTLCTASVIVSVA